MPLTRNQQAALQANGSNDDSQNSGQEQVQQHEHNISSSAGPAMDTAPDPSPSTPTGRLQAKSRNGSNIINNLNPSSSQQQHQQQSHQDLTNVTNVLGQPITSAVSNAAAAAAVASDWFGQNTTLHDDVFTGGNSFQGTPNTTPFYRMSQMPQMSPENVVQHPRSGTEELHGNSNMTVANHTLFQQSSFQTDPNSAAVAAASAAAAAAVAHHENRQRSDSTLSAAFTTPAPVSRTQIQQQHDHNRTYSFDSSINMTVSRSLQQRNDLPHHRTPGSAESSLSMDIDHVELIRHANMAHSVAASPLRRNVASDAATARVNSIGRQNRSLGQVSAAMNGSGDDGLLRLGGPLRPIDSSSFDRFGVQHSASARSISPPDHHQTTFMGNFSPNSSISSIRHAGDSSIDTSTDSVSNSATTMSAVPSQASSISADDFLHSDGKKIPKVKTRLRNIDRKAICEAARDDPKIRQEDLAARFGIERSTVSKTLKNRDKWLAIEEEGQSAFIMKHRTGKFPELEERLAKWITDEVGRETPVLDVTIRHRALEVAKDLGIGVDQFKASLGWIEKFRDRHRLPKPAAPIPPGYGDASQFSMEEEQRRVEAFRSGFELATAQHGQIQRPAVNQVLKQQQVHMSNQMDQDMNLFYSPAAAQTTNAPPPPNASTPQWPRSPSHENVMTGIQETPKASKRQYDDMASANHRDASPIDATMARMHLPGQNSQNVRPQKEQSSSGMITGPVHQHDDSGYAMTTSSSSSSSSAATGMTKRRRGATTSADLSRGGSGNGSTDESSSNGGQVSNHDNLSFKAIREQLTSTKGSQMVSNQNNSVAMANAAAAVQEIERDEQARSMMQGLQRHTSNPTINLRQSINAAAQMQQQHQQHPHTNQGQSQNGSPSAFVATPPMRPDILGMLQSAGAVSTSDSPNGTGGEDRHVTLDEARESLDVVLAFIARQPSQLSASDYFVLGNLQGQLNALANTNQDSVFSNGQSQIQHPQQSHQTSFALPPPPHHQSQDQMTMIQAQPSQSQMQQHHSHHQHPPYLPPHGRPTGGHHHSHSMHAIGSNPMQSSNANMNLLGITSEDMAMVNEMGTR